MVGTRGCGQGISLGKRQSVGMDRGVNVLRDMGRCTYTWWRCQILRYVYFTTIYNCFHVL